MKDPNRIKRALKVCLDRTWGECCECPYDCLDKCNDTLMIDALAYIEQIEARITELEAKPTKPDSGLPKGWIEIHGDSGRKMFIGASKVVSVEEGSPIDRRIVRFVGSWVYSSESVEEILEKIREATA